MKNFHAYIFLIAAGYNFYGSWARSADTLHIMQIPVMLTSDPGC